MLIADTTLAIALPHELRQHVWPHKRLEAIVLRRTDVLKRTVEPIRDFTRFTDWRALVLDDCVMDFFDRRSRSIVLRWARFLLATTDTYSTPGSTTWTTPNWLASTLTLACWGSGAGGFGPGTGFFGGGGGAYAAISGFTASAASYNVTVGAGASARNGDPGASSYFDNGSSVLAVGGQGGTALVMGLGGGAGGLASACVGTDKYSGGNGGANAAATGGGGGSSAGTGSNGNNGTAGSTMTNGPGGTAPTGGGAGGSGGATFSPQPGTGSAPGGGGGGDGTGNQGGGGGNGKVTVTYDRVYPPLRSNVVGQPGLTPLVAM